MYEFGIALREKEDLRGLNKEEIQLLYCFITNPFLSGSECYPLEIPAKEQKSCAMGFISPKAAEKLNYDYEGSGLNTYISSILDNADLKNKDHIYHFDGIKIWLDR